jgi:hypothetical protein
VPQNRWFSGTDGSDSTALAGGFGVTGGTTTRFAPSRPRVLARLPRLPLDAPARPAPVGVPPVGAPPAIVAPTLTGVPPTLTSPAVPVPCRAAGIDAAWSDAGARCPHSSQYPSSA